MELLRSGALRATGVAADESARSRLDPAGRLIKMLHPELIRLISSLLAVLAKAIDNKLAMP